MKVLVTGAAGRLGSEICRQFSSEGIDFRATDRRTATNLPYDIEVADIRNREACYSLVRGCDAVVHLANYANANMGDAQTVYNENCAMNMNIFQAAVESGIKNIIFASSIQAISGERRFDEASRQQKPSALPYLPVDGNMPPNPGNAYAASKVAGEMLLQYFCRFHSVVGTALRFPMLVRTEWMSHWHTAGPEKLARGANLDEAFTLLSFTDAARLIIATLRAPLVGFRIYLPSSQSLWLGLPMQQIVTQYYAGVPLRKAVDQMKGLADLSQIERDTGWAPADEPVTASEQHQSGAAS